MKETGAPAGKTAQLGPTKPAPARRRLSPWMVAVLAVVGALVLLGAALAQVVDFGDSGDSLANGQAGAGASPGPGPAASAGGSASAPTGPSTYPVRAGGDLGRVCDGSYYPQSPKFAGKAPHQISVGVVDSVLAPRRHMLSAVRVPDQRESIWRAWTPDNAAKSQLVACVDLAKAGKRLRTCKYSDRTPATVALDQGVYRVRLYEVATGRKLLDKPVTGADGNCPSVVFLADGDSLYSAVNDTQLYGLLRPFVMKKGK
ncbi:hypothetical protein ACQPZX_39355 [Actinoplanes sp. CA-142083]|uniref:hypothetical protein n=1 Tax=Actinoplanes sp. CA-142083 TaxID=3239903 RepID=UPI003D8C2C0D